MRTTLLYATLLLSTAAAVAQTNLRENDWTDLVDEPSRHELLSTHAEPLLIPTQFHFPQDSLADKKGPRQNEIFGIDISHYSQSGLPFAQLRDKNVRFVYVKSTQGVQFKDPKFAGFWSALEALPADKKVSRGAYHFLTAGDDPVAQAERFVAYVNLHGGFKATDLPPVVDLEWDITGRGQPDRWRNLKPAQIVQAVALFLARVEQLTGRIPMIYTARSWWVERGIPESTIKTFARNPLWIADFSHQALTTESPAVMDKVSQTLWQFSETAKLSGFADSLDANVFKGTEADFHHKFGLPATSPALADPVRFAQVNSTIYRGSRPDEQALQTLARLKVFTILDLEDDDEVVAAESELAAKYGIKVISTPMSGFWYPRTEQVNESLQILAASTTNGPIFVHCQHGEDRTGLIVGLYRVKSEGWTPAAAWGEMLGNGFHRALFLLAQYYENATGYED